MASMAAWHKTHFMMAPGVAKVMALTLPTQAASLCLCLSKTASTAATAAPKEWPVMTTSFTYMWGHHVDAYMPCEHYMHVM